MDQAPDPSRTPVKLTPACEQAEAGMHWGLCLAAASLALQNRLAWGRRRRH